MKTKLIIAVAAMLIVASCGTNRTHSVNDDGAKQEPVIVDENSQNETRPLVGAYTDQRELTEDEMALFRDVTGVGDTVFTPLSVSTQVVAGINYRYWCRFESADKSGHCWITIYKPLQGDPQLSSIKEVTE